MTRSLGTVAFANVADAVRCRQLALLVAETIGFDLAGRTRVATMVSEAVRTQLTDGHIGEVRFELDEKPKTAHLQVDVVPQRMPKTAIRGRSDNYWNLADSAAWVILGDTARLTLRRRLPSGCPSPTAAALSELRQEFRRQVAIGEIDALEAHNREMIAALAELEERRDQLKDVNRELEETNRGVIALVAQLESQTGRLERAEADLRLALAAGGMGTWRWSVGADHVKIDHLGVMPEAFDDAASPDANPCDCEPPPPRLGLQRVSTDALLGRLPGSDRRRLVAAFARATRDGGNIDVDVRVFGRAGELHLPPDPTAFEWLAIRGAISSDDQQRVDGVAGVHFNITKTKTYEQQLRHARRGADAANQVKSDLLASVSHELRTPLAAIIGYADLLDETPRDAGDAEHIDTIRRNGRYLLEIINDILDISKIEAGRLEIHVQTLRPAQILDDVRTLMSVRADQKGLRLITSAVDPMPQTIRSDPQRLRQILLNLVGNAIKFTDAGQVEVTLRIEPAGSPNLRIDVVDTGPGIAPERIDQLFEPFSQIHDRGRRHVEGTGLGLAISRRLARLLGGDLQIDRDAGAGCRFILRVQTDAAASDDGPEHATPYATSGNAFEGKPLTGRMVLVVDDDRSMRFITQNIITKAGGQTAVCENGREAVQWMRSRLNSGSETVDAVIMDMQMPVMDGYEAASVLRTEGYHGPIFALTAGAMRDERLRCTAAGCTDYLTKPVNAFELIGLLQTSTHACVVDPAYLPG